MTTRRYLVTLAATALCVAFSSIGGQAKVTTPASLGLVLDEDAEVTRIERLFSNESLSSRAAPRTWSSRFDVRWNARWQAAPKYVA